MAEAVGARPCESHGREQEYKADDESGANQGKRPTQDWAFGPGSAREHRHDRNRHKKSAEGKSRAQASDSRGPARRSRRQRDGG